MVRKNTYFNLQSFRCYSISILVVGSIQNNPFFFLVPFLEISSFELLPSPITDNLTLLFFLLHRNLSLLFWCLYLLTECRSTCFQFSRIKIMTVACPDFRISLSSGFFISFENGPSFTAIIARMNSNFPNHFFSYLSNMCA